MELLSDICTAATTSVILNEFMYAYVYYYSL